jgi:two-component system, NtrC family, sensor histidine kinase HydH
MDGAEDCSGAVLILRDLSEIKRLEDQVRHSEKLAAIGKLSAGVAHEIRNPLSSIRGFAQHLRNVLSDRPKEREYAEIMVTEVDRVNRVVTDLLTFARPMTPETEPTDIGHLIEHSIRLVSADAALIGVTIQSSVADGLQKIMLDRNQMTQALLNLFLNALHAADEGGKIEVGAGVNETADRLQVWVKDDGPGIPAGNTSKIFDPFFTTREKGTGLGLSIVRKIVEIHEGRISVESPLPGKTRGAQFMIVLPIINRA